MNSEAQEALAKQLGEMEVGAVVGVNSQGRVLWAMHGPVAGILGAMETMKIEIAINALKTLPPGEAEPPKLEVVQS